MPNFIDFQQNLNGVGAGLMNQFNQRRAMALAQAQQQQAAMLQQQEFSRQLALAQAKAQLENQFALSLEAQKQSNALDLQRQGKQRDLRRDLMLERVRSNDPYKKAMADAMTQFFQGGNGGGVPQQGDVSRGTPGGFNKDEFTPIPGFGPRGPTISFQRTPESSAKGQALVASEKERQLNVSKVGRLTNLIDVIEKKYAETKTPGGVKGAFLRPVETFSRGLQITKNQQTDKAYADFISGIKAQLARALGDVGNLSETEQRAAVELVPTLLDDPSTAKIKVQNLRDLVTTIQKNANRVQLNNKPVADNEYEFYLKAIGAQ